MPDESSPLAAERQRIILSILEREGVVRTAELKQLLNVSQVTIRNDLRELEQAGECELVWGGAITKKPVYEREMLVEQRSKLNPEAKKRIGEYAASLIENGQTIIVDAGTTTVELIHSLPRDLEYLRIVTPALNIAMAASYFPNYETIMTGGILRTLTRSLIGTQVLLALESFNADWVFLASGGFSIQNGVTTGNILEVDVKRTMAERAEKVVLLADSSKYGVKMSLNVIPLTRLSLLITDTSLLEADAEQIRALGVDLRRV